MIAAFASAEVGVLLSSRRSRQQPPSPVRGPCHSSGRNVFHMLPKIPELMKSDPYIFIHIKTNSKTFVYQIYKTQVVPKEELVLDIESEYSEVILVTCVPSFLYHSRLLIYSKLIGTY